jgi:hypothetical protein
MNAATVMAAQVFGKERERCGAARGVRVWPCVAMPSMIASRASAARVTV